MGKIASRLERTSPDSRKSPQRVISSDGFLFENFETSSDDGKLPESWTATSTPGNANDTWHVGTLGLDGEPMYGVSGMKYAYILGNQENDNPHNAWMFSPGITLQKGTKYQIEFFSIMPPSGNIHEKMEVTIGTGPSAADAILTFEEIENENDYWRWNGYEFTPEESGTYYIGFHSVSPARSNATAIDNLMISTGNVPLFNGYSAVELGATDTFERYLEGSYEFMNQGGAPLEISLVSATPGITVKTLPVTVEKGDYGDFKISVDVPTEEAGDYEGEIVIGTNDPTLPQVTISVYGSVAKARATGYVFEDFESGGPEGWILTKGSANTALQGVKGHNDSSRLYYTTSFYTTSDENPFGVGFTTHYVDMGENPEFSFWYNLTDVDMLDKVQGLTNSENPGMTVQVSDDLGKTWQEVYAMIPGTDTQHVPSEGYTQVKVSLPDYAGKRCRFRVFFTQESGSAMFNQFRVLIDDVAIGTVNPKDLKASTLTGDFVLRIGNEYQFSATVENLGLDATDDFTVKLKNLTDGTVVATAPAKEIEASCSAEFNFTWTPQNKGSQQLVCVVECDGDSNESNNISANWWVDVTGDDNSGVSVNGTGDIYASMLYPINFNSYSSATQTIYYANEIGINKGEISSLLFTSYLEVPYKSDTFEVLIGETDNDDFKSGEMVDPESLTKVFEGTMYFLEGTNQVVIPFYEPYKYAGGNIVVMTKRNSDEFIYNKAFIIRRDKDVLRSIQKATLIKGNTWETEDAIVNEVYPVVTFNMVKPEAGSISGTVTATDSPVEGTLVTIKNTKRTMTSAANGKYEFPEIAEGTYTVTFDKHGYYPVEKENVSVTSSAPTTLDVTLTELPEHTLTGTVTNAATGLAIKGATVKLSGYDDFHTVTDDSGAYTISGIKGDTGKAYKLLISTPFHKATTSAIDINTQSVADMALNELLLSASNVNGTIANNKVMLSWEKPWSELRYDDGDPIEHLGFTHGFEEVIFGSVFKKHTLIKEVDWFTTDKFFQNRGEHSRFNVFIFGLDEEGNPNPKDIIYKATDVDFTDNAWSKHILSKPVEVDGYMAAISCNGFMALGVTAPSDEYPFEEGQHFYAGDSYNYNIVPMSSYMECHPMIRVYGDDVALGEESEATRPCINYEIYRYADGADSADWTLLCSTAETTHLDESFANLESGDYRFAVVAVYTSGKARPAESPLFVNKSNGLDSVTDDSDLQLIPNPCDAYFRISGNADAAQLAIFDMDGSLMLRIGDVDGDIAVSHLVSGIYLVVVQSENGSVTTRRLVKK